MPLPPSMRLLPSRAAGIALLIGLASPSCAPVRSDDDDATLSVDDDDDNDGLWWTTCGDPVCSGWVDSGNPACTDEVVGAGCGPLGAQCDLGDGCNVRLLCALEDPKEPSCPISQRSRKTDIRYLDPVERARLAEQVTGLRLAHWRYLDAADGAGERVGFIIEDRPADAAGVRDGRVDLYGYTTMAMAALQEQERRLNEQQRQLDALRAELDALKAAPR